MAALTLNYVKLLNLKILLKCLITRHVYPTTRNHITKDFLFFCYNNVKYIKKRQIKLSEKISSSLFFIFWLYEIKYFFALLALF